MDGIDNKYIEDAIVTLMSTVGMKSHVNDSTLISLVGSNKVTECVNEIAKYLGLPIKIELSYVSEGYQKDNKDNFDSSHLVKTDWRGRGNEGIVAQVIIPSNLPMYGTPGLNGFPIKVRVSKNCTESPAAFIHVMAHELSHVVLHSLWHAKKNNEVYTDITAMMLGFSVIISNGREVIRTTEERDGIKTQTTKYGYLSDEQFGFAYHRIASTADRYTEEKNELVEKIKKSVSVLIRYRRMISYFQKYLLYIDKKLKRKMSQEDGQRISAFHQVNYLDGFEQVIPEAKRNFSKINTFVENLNHYTEQSLSTLRKNKRTIQDTIDELDSKYSKLQSDVGILEKYISIWYRMRVFISIHFGREHKK